MNWVVILNCNHIQFKSQIINYKNEAKDGGVAMPIRPRAKSSKEGVLKFMIFALCHVEKKTAKSFILCHDISRGRN